MIDSLAAPDGEGDAFLEWVIEVVGLPVLDIIGILQLAIDVDINVLQEAKIELLADNIFMVLLQVHEAAVIRLFECPQEVITDVVCIVLGGTNSDLLSVVCHSVAPVVFLPGLPEHERV